LRFLSRHARKAMPPGAHAVLNIGIGNGWLERQCAGFGWTVYALDPDAMAARALSAKGITAVTGTIDRLPFADGRFDAVFCSEVLEHLSDEQLTQAMHEITRVLKDDGLLIGTVPHREDLRENQVICPHCGELFHRWGHQQAFDKAAVRQALESAGLAIRRLSVRAFRDYAKATAVDVAKFLIRWPLARAGSTLIYANIFFVARKPAVPS
jgi:SAM-dependent methyltransferase